MFFKSTDKCFWRSAVSAVLISIFALIAFICAGCKSSPEIQKEVKDNISEPGQEKIPIIEEKIKEVNPYLKGIAFYKNGDFEKAVEQFNEAVKSYPEIGDYPLYYLFRINEKLNNFNECKGIYERLSVKFSKSRWIEECMYRIGKIYFGENRWQECINLFNEFSKKFSKSTLQIRFLLYAGISYMNIGEMEKGKEALVFLWLNYPLRNESKEAEKYLKEDIYKTKDLENKFSPPELFTRAEKFLGAGKFEENLSILTFISNGDFEINYKLTALRKIAESYEKEKKYSLAIDIYKQLIKETEKQGDKRILPEIYLKLAKACYQINREEEFNRTKKITLKKFPKSSAIKDILYISGRYLEDEKRFDESVKEFLKILGIKNSPYKEDSFWHIGWSYYLKGDSDKASRYFLKGMKMPGKHRNRDMLTYWYCRSLEKNNNKEKAAENMKENLSGSPGYYGILSRYRLEEMSQPFLYSRDRFDIYYKKMSGRGFNFLYPLLPKEISSDVMDRNFTREAKYYFERAFILKGMKLVDDSIVELKYVQKEIQKNNKEALTLLAELFWEYGDYYTSVKILNNVPGTSSVGDNRFERLYKMFYPLPYWDKVIECTERLGLDPFLLYAIMRQESVFDPRALSSAGAIGLLQLMPDTAMHILRKRGEAGFDKEKLYDKNVNISLGAEYISELLVRYNNNLVFAIAAYNSGEKKTEEWISRFKGRDLDEFIESITYPETKNYVKKVIENYETYFRIYQTEE